MFNLTTIMDFRYLLKRFCVCGEGFSQLDVPTEDCIALASSLLHVKLRLQLTRKIFYLLLQPIDPSS
jgi:hypothetical protein